MPMNVFVFASHKGGSGKTTLAANLAVCAERHHPGQAALMDTDPQGSLAAWRNVRGPATPAFINGEADGDLLDQLAALETAGCRHVFIDTPPRVNAAVRVAIRAATLVIVPCRPSFLDIAAIGDTVDLVRSAHKAGLLVLNGTQRASRVHDAAVAALEGTGEDIPLSGFVLGQRVDFAASMITGATVLEFAPRSRAAAEVINLWHDIAARLSVLYSNWRSHGQELVADPAAPLEAG